MANVVCLIQVNYKDHDVYMPGDEIEGVDAELAEALVAAGAVKVIAEVPAPKKGGKQKEAAE